MNDEKMKEFGKRILSEYSQWSAEYNKSTCKFENDVLIIDLKGKKLSVSVDTENDITFFTESGRKGKGMYFNLRDLTTDNSLNPEKTKLELYMRLHYGLTFLE